MSRFLCQRDHPTPNAMANAKEPVLDGTGKKRVYDRVGIRKPQPFGYERCKARH